MVRHRRRLTAPASQKYKRGRFQDARRERSGRESGLRPERSHRDLSHHALLQHGRARRCLGRRRQEKPVENRALRYRDAKRGRSRRCDSRRAADRFLQHDLHRVAGLAADDSQHVQDRRRTDFGRLSRLCPLARRAGPLHLRGSQRRHGRPSDRLGPACFRFRAGSPGFRVHRPGRDLGGTPAFPPFLRRLPHIA